MSETTAARMRYGFRLSLPITSLGFPRPVGVRVSRPGSDNDEGRLGYLIEAGGWYAGRNEQPPP